MEVTDNPMMILGYDIMGKRSLCSLSVGESVERHGVTFFIQTAAIYWLREKVFSPSSVVTGL